MFFFLTSPQRISDGGCRNEWICLDRLKTKTDFTASIVLLDALVGNDNQGRGVFRSSVSVRATGAQSQGDVEGGEKGGTHAKVPNGT